MTDPIDGAIMQSCTVCGRLWFPARLLCPACGADAFSERVVAAGTVEQVTTRGDEDRAVATVTADGVRVIARVPLATAPGDVLALTRDPTRPSAAFVPH